MVTAAGLRWGRSRRRSAMAKDQVGQEGFPLPEEVLPLSILAFALGDPSASDAADLSGRGLSLLEILPALPIGHPVAGPLSTAVQRFFPQTSSGASHSRSWIGFSWYRIESVAI